MADYEGSGVGIMTDEIITVDTNKLPSFIFEIEKADKDGNTVKIRHFNRIKLADAMHQAFHTIYFNENLYIYDKEKHYYRKAANEIETTIRDLLKNFDVLENSLTGLINEIRTHLRSIKAYSENPFDNYADKIPVRNGIIQFNYEKGTVELINHGPEHLFTYYINADFDEKTGTTPALKILGQWVKENDVGVLIQLPAQALYQKMHHITLKKSYLFDGETDCAKSTYLDMISEFIGYIFVCGASLHDICNKDFVTGSMEGKLLNINHELSTVTLENVENFKKITGSIYNEVHHKGVDRYNGEITCVFAFSSNKPPMINKRVQTDVAFWNRWIITTFPNSFKKDLQWTEKNLTDEFYSAFLNCVIDMILKMKKSNTLPFDMTAEEAYIEWTTRSSSVGSFVNSDWFMNQPSGNQQIEYDKDETLKLYWDFCRQEDLADNEIVKDKDVFCNKIQAFGFTPARKRVRDKDGMPGRIFIMRSWLIPTKLEHRQRVMIDKKKANGNLCFPVP